MRSGNVSRCEQSWKKPDQGWEELNCDGAVQHGIEALNTEDEVKEFQVARHGISLLLNTCFRLSKRGLIENMEMVQVKCELSPGRRRACMGNDEMRKCVKRRRREPNKEIVDCDNLQNEKGQQQNVDQATTSSTTVKRSSRFRGVSRHRWTGRFEAHLWDKGSWNVTQKKKGKQGAYDEEESAARAYDLAALKYWGPTTFTNFLVSDYEKEMETMQNLTKEEYLATLRRKSSGFSRGVSKYRGVARHHNNGRWEARIGRVFGNKYLYLGTYSTQEEAAHAYDIAAIEYRGINAVTNFDLSTYIRWLRPGTNTQITSQEPQTNAESKTLLCDSYFHTNTFITDDWMSLHKQQYFPTKSPTSYCSNSSSPTALSLLLRSSVFKQLKEKNSSLSDDEIDIDGVGQQVGSDDDEDGGIFFNGIGDVPYVNCASNVNGLPINLHEESETQSSFYNQTGQSLGMVPWGLLPSVDQKITSP
ncbi:hypothetical protein Sjap_015809 [Stephania japonica]|uniref:AP2/ERF domain-containing protein n=1 Tax=Stephania japonica TaxID=461633 RepID=A0AAP0IK41_9MAGN